MDKIKEAICKQHSIILFHLKEKNNNHGGLSEYINEEK